RFLLLAALRLFFGTFARLLRGAAARLLLLGLSSRFLLGAAARLFGGSLLLLAAPILFGESAAALFLHFGLTCILHCAGAAGLSLGGQRTGQHKAAPRRFRRRGTLRRLLSRNRRRRLGSPGLGCTRADCAFFAHLDRDGLRAPVREALAHLRRLDRLA